VSLSPSLFRSPDRAACLFALGYVIGPQAQTNRIPPITLVRRWRQNVSGVVTPSPVGPAIENERTPSPPSPNPAVDGPLITKIVQSMILPIRDITEVSRECRTAVCPKPCSLSLARAMALSAFETLTNGTNGIICSR